MTQPSLQTLDLVVGTLWLGIPLTSYSFKILGWINNRKSKTKSFFSKKPIKFIKFWVVRGHVLVFSCIQLFAALWTRPHEAPLSKGFFRQQYWSGLPFPLLGDRPNPRIEPTYPVSPALPHCLYWILDLLTLKCSRTIIGNGDGKALFCCACGCCWTVYKYPTCIYGKTIGNNFVFNAFISFLALPSCKRN